MLDEGEEVLEGKDFFEVSLVCYHKFKERFRAVGEKGERRSWTAQGFGVVGITEFRGNVVLGNEGIELWTWLVCSIRFDFDCGEKLGDFGQELEELCLLEERFSSSDDKAISGLGQFGQEGRDFGCVKLDDLLFFGVFLIVFVFPRGVFPIPGVGGVAPNTVEVTERQAQKDGWIACRRAFSLDGPKNFGRAVFKAGEFH